jgi:hypothetical protein
VLKLLLPISASRVRIGPQRILSTELTLTDKGYRERPDSSRVGRAVGRTIRIISVGAAEQSFAAPSSRGIRKVAETEQFQGYGLKVSETSALDSG